MPPLWMAGLVLKMSDALGAVHGAWAGCSGACEAAAPQVVDGMQKGGAMGFFLPEEFTCAMCLGVL